MTGPEKRWTEGKKRGMKAKRGGGGRRQWNFFSGRGREIKSVMSMEGEGDTDDATVSSVTSV